MLDFASVDLIPDKVEALYYNTEALADAVAASTLSGEGLVVPPGVYHTFFAPAAGLRLRAYGATFINRYDGRMVLKPGQDTVNYMDSVDPVKAGDRVLRNPFVQNPSEPREDTAGLYRPGDVVYAFALNLTAERSLSYRRVVAGSDAAAKTVTLTQPVDGALQVSPAVTRIHNAALVDTAVLTGSNTVWLVHPQDAAKFAYRQWVMMTDGPWINELYADFARVLSADTLTGIVKLDRPLRRSYRTGMGCLCAGPFCSDVTIEGLALGTSAYDGQAIGFFKYMPGLNLRDMHFGQGLPGFAAGPVALTVCGPATLRNCSWEFLLSIDATHDTTLDQCVDSGGITGEQFATNLRILDCQFNRKAFNFGNPMRASKVYVRGGRYACGTLGPDDTVNGVGAEWTFDGCELTSESSAPGVLRCLEEKVNFVGCTVDVQLNFAGTDNRLQSPMRYGPHARLLTGPKSSGIIVGPPTPYGFYPLPNLPRNWYYRAHP